MEHFWQLDTFCRLVVLEQSSDDARQCQGAAVKTVRKLRFAFVITKAAFQTVGLVSLEVADAAYFKPSFLGSAPHFHIIGEGTGKSHISPAQFQGTKWQFEF